MKPTFKNSLNSSAGAVPYEKCAAKTRSDGRPGTSVFDHCRYAGVVAKVLLANVPEDVFARLPATAALLVALHDIGKVSPGFQGKYFPKLLEKYASEWLRRKPETDHAAIGEAAYRAIASVEKDDAESKAIACHHGSVKTILTCNADGQAWQRERMRLVEALAESFGERFDARNKIGKSWRLLAGLMCVADWIASNEKYFPADAESIPSERLVDHVSTTLSSIGFSPIVFRDGLAFGDIFQEDGCRFSPRSEQTALMKVVHNPGVYVMEATMGAGKTEAALAAAYTLISSRQNAGIYFALPTRLTSDRIYGRMQEFLDRAMENGFQIRLSHGRAWLEGYQIGGTETDGRLPSWFAPSKRGLLYPFAVGTIDQALLAAMNVRHSFVRLFGLAGKVVILDEVHSYDVYTGSLVRALVRDLRQVGSTVIILSATLTRAMRDALLGCETPPDAPYPLVTGNVNGKLVLEAPQTDSAEKRVALRRVDGADTVVGDALAKARIGCNVLCVANTVRQAQRWYRLLKTQMNADDLARLRVGLLHSRFPDFRRGMIEDEWMTALGRDGTKRPTGSVLISTQIVEQSVDVDADYLISEISPIDMLFQRMGRLWRHERANRPVVKPVCVLAFDGQRPDLKSFTVESFRSGIGAGSCCVYAPYVLLRTLRILDGRDELSIPTDMRPLLESVYADQEEEPDSVPHAFKDELEEKRRAMQGSALAAEAHVESLPVQDDSEDAPPTRYGSRKTVSLLLVKSCDDGVGHGQLAIELMDGTSVRVDAKRPDFAITKALYANVVSVPVNKMMGTASRENEGRLLARHFHAREMPFICRVEDDGSLRLAFSNEPTGLSYRAEYGVMDSGVMTEATDVVAEDAARPFVLGETEW